MGGFGSGRHAGYGKKTTGDVPCLDIRKMQVSPGATGLRFEWQGVVYAVPITWTALHFGGQRPWWQCPECGERCAILHFGAKVGCRTCLDLAYQTNRESKAQKAFTRARKVRGRLGWHTALASPPGARKKGMHWSTMARHLRELERHTRDVMTVSMTATRRIQCKLEKMGLD